MKIQSINSSNITNRGSIKVKSKHNKHVPLLFNKLKEVMETHKCGGVFNTGTGEVSILTWSGKVHEEVVEKLDKLNIIF